MVSGYLKNSSLQKREHFIFYKTHFYKKINYWMLDFGRLIVAVLDREDSENDLIFPHSPLSLQCTSSKNDDHVYWSRPEKTIQVTVKHALKPQHFSRQFSAENFKSKTPINTCFHLIIYPEYNIKQYCLILTIFIKVTIINK